MPKKKTQDRTPKASAATPKPAPKPGSGRVKVGRVPKPWGYETIWAQSERYVGKILHINAGQELSVQYHNKKLKVGQSFRNTPGTIHQMVALTDCDVLEVSTPELDDVVRLSDKYGREGTSAP